MDDQQPESHLFGLSSQQVSDSRTENMAGERDSNPIGYHMASNALSNGNSSPSKSDASCHTGSSMSLDMNGIDQSATRKPQRSPSLNSASQLAERIKSRLSVNSAKHRGHRRSHSYNLPIALGDALGVEQLQTDGGEAAILSSLLNFSKREESMQAEIPRQNAQPRSSGYGLPPIFPTSTAAPNGQFNTSHHGRSLSIDDGMLGSLHSLSAGDARGQGSEDLGDKSMFNNDDDSSKYENIEEMDGEEAIRRVLASNKKVQDIESMDPKRAKRILANRLSAARSKERKTRYIGELEEKVNFYEKQATALKATLTLLQRETASLAEINESAAKKMQLVEKLYRQKEAENKQLLDEVEILRQATCGRVSMNGSQPSNTLNLEQEMLALLQMQMQPQSGQSNQAQQQQQQSHFQQQHHFQQQQQQQHQQLSAQQQLLAHLTMQSNNANDNSFMNGSLSSFGNQGSGGLNLLNNSNRP